MNLPSLPKGRLEEQFHEHKPLYSRSDALAEANRCLYCHDAPCIMACPTHIDIPSFIKKIATDNLRGAARTILSSNVLGYSCARVCPVEVLCVGACVYNHDDTPPIAIGRLQRYATEHIIARALLDGATPLFTPKAKIGKRVALVGAGPASLSCGAYLALQGVDVTLFEKRAVAGGLNSTGIAPYKLMVDDAQVEVSFIQSLGVAIKTGVEVDAPFAARLLEEYDAVFLGVGLGGDKRMGIPGEDDGGILGATRWIERLKTDPGYKLLNVEKAIVIGGGNTALDAVQELAHLGVPSVTMLYRRTEADMSGYAHEADGARNDGVHFLFERVPIRAHHDGGRLTALTVAWAENGRPVPGTEHDLAADLILVAIGQSRLVELASHFPRVRVEDGRFVADLATGLTDNPKVYVGGDALNGGKEVVNAVEEGKLAAQAMLRSFGLDVTLVHPPKTAAPYQTTSSLIGEGPHA